MIKNLYKFSNESENNNQEFISNCCLFKHYFFSFSLTYKLHLVIKYLQFAETVDERAKFKMY